MSWFTSPVVKFDSSFNVLSLAEQQAQGTGSDEMQWYKDMEVHLGKGKFKIYFPTVRSSTENRFETPIFLKELGFRHATIINIVNA